MKKMDVRVKRTYNQLLGALLELLSEKSFDDITVLEICSRADVHRATFYKHFVDKYDFLNACFKMKLSELNLSHNDAAHSMDALKESCLNMILRVINFVESNYRMLSYVSKNEYSAAFSTALSDAVAEFIEERLNVVKPNGLRFEKYIPMLANYYAGAVVGIVKWWITSDNPCTKQDLLDFSKIKINDLFSFFEEH